MRVELGSEPAGFEQAPGDITPTTRTPSNRPGSLISARLPSARSHRVPHVPFAPVAAAPPIRLDDPAGQHRPIELESLPDDFEPKLVKVCGRGQVRARAGSPSTSRSSRCVV